MQVDDAAVAALLEGQNGVRYSFRKRNAAQKAPYTVDQLQYKHALKDNPDAIIKIKNLERRHHHRHPDDRYEDEDEGTQRDGYLPEGNDHDADEEWEERERRKRRRAEKAKVSGPERTTSGERETREYPGILRDSLSTDDEEREMDAVSKKARKDLRAQERQEAKEREERLRRQKAEKIRRLQPFPLVKLKSTPSNPLASLGATHEPEVLHSVFAHHVANISLGATGHRIRA